MKTTALSAILLGVAVIPFQSDAVTLGDSALPGPTLKSVEPAPRLTTAARFDGRLVSQTMVESLVGEPVLGCQLAEDSDGSKILIIAMDEGDGILSTYHISEERIVSGTVSSSAPSFAGYRLLAQYRISTELDARRLVFSEFTDLYLPRVVSKPGTRPGLSSYSVEMTLVGQIDQVVVFDGLSVWTVIQMRDLESGVESEESFGSISCPAADADMESILCAEIGDQVEDGLLEASEVGADFTESVWEISGDFVDESMGGTGIFAPAGELAGKIYSSVARGIWKVLAPLIGDAAEEVCEVVYGEEVPVESVPETSDPTDGDDGEDGDEEDEDDEDSTKTESGTGYVPGAGGTSPGGTGPYDPTPRF